MLLCQVCLCTIGLFRVWWYFHWPSAVLWVLPPFSWYDFSFKLAFCAAQCSNIGVIQKDINRDADTDLQEEAEEILVHTDASKW